MTAAIFVRSAGRAAIFCYLCTSQKETHHTLQRRNTMKTLSRNAIIGYPAGIITGVTYGLNPLFAIPLMQAGAATESILLFRYGIAVVLLGLFLWLSGQSFRITKRQAGVLLALGLLYTCSSLCLFEAYKFIASGLATTLVFLYPVLVAIIMVFFRVVPSWPVWLAIVMTFVGVIMMTHSSSPADAVNPIGIALAIGSATVYAAFIVIINRSKAIGNISNTLLTFYALLIGAVVFGVRIQVADVPVMAGLNSASAWLLLIGLAVLPTIVSTASLAIATRNIGATKASVMGVFEPITAILIGTLMFHEPLTPNIVIGIIIAVAAVVFMVQATKR